MVLGLSRPRLRVHTACGFLSEVFFSHRARVDQASCWFVLSFGITFGLLVARVHISLGLAYLGLNDRGSAVEQYKILKKLDTELANKLFNAIYL